MKLLIQFVPGGSQTIPVRCRPARAARPASRMRPLRPALPNGRRAATSPDVRQPDTSGAFDESIGMKNLFSASTPAEAFGLTTSGRVRGRRRIIGCILAILCGVAGFLGAATARAASPGETLLIHPVHFSGAALTDGIQAVQQSRGSRADAVTWLDVADQLESRQGHGALWELQVSRQYEQAGRRAVFTKAGNVGTDLRVFPGAGAPMTFVQAKATQNALGSAEAALLDGLAFAGKQANRPPELLAGRIAFEGRIPADQFAQLVKSGTLQPDGTPSALLVRRVAAQAARDAAGSGETAARLRGALPVARKLLPQFKVLPGPATYPELLQATRESAAAVRAAATQWGAQAARPIGRLAPGAHALPRLGKTVAAVGIITGPLQIHEGIQEIRAGERVVGSGHVAGGAATVGAAGAALSGATVLCVGLLAAGAGIDGGVDLYQGIQTTNTTRMVIGGVKCVAAGAMAAGLATGQPVLILAGGLVYVGVVVGDTLQQIHAAEQQRIVEAARNYFARIGPVTLPPEQYLGIGLSPTDEKALHTLFAIKTR